jgi:hypothetical protein
VRRTAGIFDLRQRGLRGSARASGTASARLNTALREAARYQPPPLALLQKHALAAVIDRLDSSLRREQTMSYADPDTATRRPQVSTMEGILNGRYPGKGALGRGRARPSGPHLDTPVIQVT